MICIFTDFFFQREKCQIIFNKMLKNKTFGQHVFKQILFLSQDQAKNTFLQCEMLTKEVTITCTFPHLRQKVIKAPCLIFEPSCCQLLLRQEGVNLRLCKRGNSVLVKSLKPPYQKKKWAKQPYCILLVFLSTNLSPSKMDSRKIHLMDIYSLSQKSS